MQLKIRSKEDFYAGLMFIGFGVLAVVVARNYPMGSAMRIDIPSPSSFSINLV